MRLEERINQNPHYSDTEYKLLEYILSAKSEIVDLNTNQLAKLTFSSPASVTRLSKKLGFSGFNEFKYSLKIEIQNQKKTNVESWALLQEDIDKTIKLVSESDFSPINQLILDSENLFVFGTDWGERNAAELFIRNYLTAGIYMISVPSITELRWVTEKINKNDTIIIISYSGENEDIKKISQLIEMKQASLISITPISKNHLSKLTPFNVYYHVTELEKMSQNPTNEYNMFTTLHIVLDAIFRDYIDNFYRIQ